MNRCPHPSLPQIKCETNYDTSPSGFNPANCPHAPDDKYCVGEMISYAVPVFVTDLTSGQYNQIVAGSRCPDFAYNVSVQRYASRF